MATERQIEANRRNAQHSTGPKTAAGKGAVRMNAVKHGLCCQDTVLACEDPQAFAEMETNLRQELAPAGELEKLLFRRIVSLSWRLQRAGRLEAGIYTFHLRERSRTAERAAEPAPAAPVELGEVFAREAATADTFVKLSRVEARLERSLLKLLQQLRILQSESRAEDRSAPPPAANPLRAAA